MMMEQYSSGTNGSADAAKKIVEDMTREIKMGERFDGVITKVVEFGAFVKLAGQTEGLVHVSEIAPFRVERVTDYLKEGMTVPVIVKGTDERGKISLSIKQIAPEMFQKTK